MKGSLCLCIIAVTLVQAASGFSLWPTHILQSLRELGRRYLLDSSSDNGPTSHVSKEFNITECRDHNDTDCHKYDYQVCYDYQPWALQRCAAYCEFCTIDPKFTTPAPPCNDTIPNCHEFNKDTCTNPNFSDWAHNHCRSYCNFCHETHHPNYRTTTPMPTTTVKTTTDAACHDTIANCADYGNDVCTGSYKDWAGVRCRAYCSFCGTSPPPTTAPPCVDLVKNCNQFQKDTCVNSFYKSWAEKNCRAYCEFCNVTQTTTPASTTTQTTMPTTTTTPTTTKRVTLSPYEGHGATGTFGEFFCVYHGTEYKQDETWKDGCQLECTCEDAEFNDVSCADICPHWNLPSSCQQITVPGKCCPTIHCNMQS
ncbi:uncharacterized protein LOC124146049 isoform X2 [Haliotis rufescens]|uniref:uncharacterized protein LOC124146049 isoform X1 n=1 Tax=Haliotis rufescens TaxID=6454 RepID=UPI00201FB37E|nr:uncharacterized protein LOC124146049 isoform X1 [Haliotis rufescens]XP_048249340.1 uncharacterized protein LOC124146049 isoform X2 [Haliotis rufescens]